MRVPSLPIAGSLFFHTYLTNHAKEKNTKTLNNVNCLKIYGDWSVIYNEIN